MDSFILSYRDPLFAVITLFIIIFIISFTTYWYGIYKKNKEQDSIKNFLKRFESNSFDDDFLQVLKQNKIPLNTIMILANSYYRSGEYEKAIKIYIFIIDCNLFEDNKCQILHHLGKTYFKAGFLYRSRDIFLETLKLNPTNDDALKMLCLTYERLFEFDKAKETLEPLNLLGFDTTDEESYFNALNICHDSSLKMDKKVELLFNIMNKNRALSKVVGDFLIKNQIDIFWQNLDKFEVEKHFDLLWYLSKEKVSFDIIKNSSFLNELFSAKGYIKEPNSSSVFELDVLINLKKSGFEMADLNFEYLCVECKNSFPVYSYRCPNCFKLFSEEITPVLTKKFNQLTYS